MAGTMWCYKYNLKSKKKNGAVESVLIVLKIYIEVIVLFVLSAALPEIPRDSSKAPKALSMSNCGVVIKGEAFAAWKHCYQLLLFVFCGLLLLRWHNINEVPDVWSL